MARRTGDRSTYKWLLENYPIDENSAASIYQIFDEQVRYSKAESISTRHRFVIEEHLDKEHYRRYYYFHSLYGRPFNDGLSRIIAYIVSRERTSNVTLSVSDHGFFLSVPLSKKLDIVEYLTSLDESIAKELLRYSLEESQLLKRMFRINATRSLMILRNYKGHQKSARRQQVSADMMLSFAHKLENFSVLEESYRRNNRGQAGDRPHPGDRPRNKERRDRGRPHRRRIPEPPGVRHRIAIGVGRGAGRG